MGYLCLGKIILKRMFVYNMTFHLDRDALEEALRFIRNTYIPQVMASGVFHTPSLRRIVAAEEEEGGSYAVQFHVEDPETLNRWMNREGQDIHRSISRRFGDKVAGFSTLLEEVDWES
jgi:hypothetical protein